MFSLVNYFESIPVGTDLRDDQQYQSFLELKRLRARQTAIEKEKLTCCGVELIKNEPRLAIVDQLRFNALVSEASENEKVCTRILLKLNAFDTVTQEARSLGVEVPTLNGIERAYIAAGNQLLTRRMITRSRIEELLVTRPSMDAADAVSHPSVSKMEIESAELNEKYEKLGCLVEAARRLL